MFPNLVLTAKALAAERLYEENALHSCHVAFILNKNKILSIGVNDRKTHPGNLQYKYNNQLKIGRCAEFDALIKSRSLEHFDNTMVVLRVNRRGQLAMSKPCPGCDHMINQIGFRRVWFSNAEGKIEKLNNPK